jgi:hypothetical protein
MECPIPFPSTNLFEARANEDLRNLPMAIINYDVKGDTSGLGDLKGLTKDVSWTSRASMYGVNRSTIESNPAVGFFRAAAI